MTTQRRVGFACKLSTVDASGAIRSVPEANYRVTTLAWLARQSAEAQHDKLLQLTKHNLDATSNLIEYVGQLPAHQRMVRLGSDILPLYTARACAGFCNDSTVQQLCASRLSAIGARARALDVRLSFHPAQFCVLASSTPTTVDSSITEIEYHTTVATMMGYAQSFADFKINVHLSGGGGPTGFRAAYARLSESARQMLTIENDEYTSGLPTCLQIADLVPIVLDVHHHMLHDNEWIACTDSRIAQVIDSWRGVRPVVHYTQSREQYQTHDLYDSAALNVSKQKLRAHSDYMHNQAINDWMLQHWEWADIMVEAKGKNLASDQLVKYWTRGL